MGFQYFEFNVNKKLNFDIVIDDTTDLKDAHYNIIISTIIMDMMGINILFSKKMIYEDSDVCPMKVYGSF